MRRLRTVTQADTTGTWPSNDWFDFADEGYGHDVDGAMPADVRLAIRALADDTVKRARLHSGQAAEARTTAQRLRDQARQLRSRLQANAAAATQTSSTPMMTAAEASQQLP